MRGDFTYKKTLKNVSMTFFWLQWDGGPIEVTKYVSSFDIFVQWAFWKLPSWSYPKLEVYRKSTISNPKFTIWALNLCAYNGTWDRKSLNIHDVYHISILDMIHRFQIWNSLKLFPSKKNCFTSHLSQQHHPATSVCVASTVSLTSTVSVGGPTGSSLERPQGDRMMLKIHSLAVRTCLEAIPKGNNRLPLPSIFRCELLVSGRVWFHWKTQRILAWLHDLDELKLSRFTLWICHRFLESRSKCGLFQELTSLKSFWCFHSWLKMLVSWVPYFMYGAD